MPTFFVLSTRSRLSGHEFGQKEECGHEFEEILAFDQVEIDLADNQVCPPTKFDHQPSLIGRQVWPSTKFVRQSSLPVAMANEHCGSTVGMPKFLAMKIFINLVLAMWKSYRHVAKFLVKHLV